MHCPDEFSPLRRVLVRAPEAAFVDAARIEREWRALGYAAAPDLARAGDEHARLVEVLESLGARVQRLPADAAVGLDGIYVRDAALVSPRGAILCAMGKPARAAEPEVLGRLLAGLDLPVCGAIEGSGRLEGGDVVWLDARTLVVGRGYRTNAEGVRQLRAILGDAVTVVEVALPHWRGPDDVFHLMSMISPLDRDLALVHSPLLPVPFREWLIGRGVTLVEVADGELDSLGGNVLAVAPRVAVMIAGNPRTRAALERAGVEVHQIAGADICLPGSGGPTCLTRPIERG